MRVIPVLDVRRGQAVRAVAGDRAHYGPLRSILHGGTDPVALARAGRDAWGLPDLYLADLDAILGESCPDVLMYRAIRGLGLTPWVDAGVRDARDLPPLIEAGVGRIVVGLETVRGPGALERVVLGATPDRVVFGLDLRGGRPLVDTRASWGTDDIRAIIDRVIDMGVPRIIHLDLARVGTGLGVGPLELASSSRGPVEWIVGGGISSAGEIRSLDGAMIRGVLVGSALHDGRIGPDDLASLRAPDGSQIGGRRPG